MTIRVPLAVSLALLSLPVFGAGVSAQTVRPHQTMVTCKVSLVVSNPIAADTTLWLVYGPPAPTFGIVRMHHASGSLYTASVRLPAGSRARFSYLAGRGTLHTQGEIAPGNPVVTIRQLAPTTISARPVPTVHWNGTSS